MIRSLVLVDMIMIAQVRGISSMAMVPGISVSERHWMDSKPNCSSISDPITVGIHAASMRVCAFGSRSHAARAPILVDKTDGPLSLPSGSIHGPSEQSTCCPKLISELGQPRHQIRWNHWMSSQSWSRLEDPAMPTGGSAPDRNLP